MVWACGIKTKKPPLGTASEAYWDSGIRPE